MKVKVGIVGVNAVSITLILAENTRDTANMHTGNYQAVALAVAKRRLDCAVFPIEIDRPAWLPEKGGK